MEWNEFQFLHRKPSGIDRVDTVVSGSQKAFTLAEVLMAKRMSDKTCSQEFVRMSEPKAPTNIINKLCAFTLAEVLITLAIIGVVAALTIPTVVRNYQERQTVTQVKKVYSQLNSAFQMAVVENGSPENWTWGAEFTSSSSSSVFKKYLMPYFRVQKYCDNSTGCFSKEAIPYFNGANSWTMSGTWVSANLADGTSLGFATMSRTCGADWSATSTKPLNSSCAIFAIDVNGGAKKPNIFGRDIFTFIMTKYGILPYGTKNHRSYGYLRSYCTKDTSVTYYASWGCAAWILAKGNMDYLKKEVSW